MRSPGTRRYVILTDGYLTDGHAKTAHGVLRYAKDDIVAVIDRDFAGQQLRDVLPSCKRDAPIVSTTQESLAHAPTSLLVGVAVPGGAIPPRFRTHILAAIDAGIEIVNGLHQFISEDPQFAAHARASGTRLWDVRRPPEDIALFSGAAYAAPQIVVLAVGSDCAVGKMSAMLELASAASDAGERAEFVATGQTGILIAGKGIAVDRVISDFVSGAAEQLVLDVAPDAGFAFVEGQGSIIHPAFAAVTYGLLLGCAPDLLVLCHDVEKTSVEEFDVPIPDLRTLKTMYEAALAPVKPAPCVAVALNTRNLSAAQAQARIRAEEAQTSLATDDVVRFGGHTLWRAVRSAAERTPKWRARRRIARS